MSPEIGILVGLLLLVGNAFFVGAEFSLISVRRSTIEPLAANGSKRARITLKALENISLLMAGAQLGITLCSLGLGAIAEPAIAHLLEGPFHQINVPEHLLHPFSFTVALTLVIFLHVVIGEMVPKNIALAGPEKASLILTPTLVRIVTILKPLIQLLNMIANGILLLCRVKPKTEVTSSYTRDEMADLVKESRKGGYLSEDNEQLLSGALAFDTQTVQKIIIPIEEVITVGLSITHGELEALAVKTGFSRFPVVDGQGKYQGYIHLKDNIQNDEQFIDQPINKQKIRELISISDTQSIRMTLKVMQRSGAHIAAVTSDEGLVGLVALEDVLEELVGEL